jgi:hypothetical protein
MSMTLHPENVNAFVQEAMARLLPLFERLDDPPPPLPFPGIWPSPPFPTSRSAIRRTIRRYRAGKVRPVDPSIDPQAAADAIEKDLAYAELVDTVEEEVDTVYRALARREDSRYIEVTVEALDVFAKTRHLDRDPEGELAVLVSRMRRAMEIVDEWWRIRMA